MSTADAVRACERAWIDAHLAADAERFASLPHDDFVSHDDFVYSNGRGVFRKDAYVDNLRSGAIDMRDLENAELEVLELGETAVSFGVSLLDASFQGADISGRDRFTRVWKKTPDGWRALVLHANAIPHEA